jgi:hypothetical protein
MANTTITNLPLAVSLTGTEQIPAVQSSSTVRLTVSQIATYTATIVAPPTLSIGNGISGGTPGYGLYVDASTTLGQFAYGSGVFNAIKTATGTTGAPVLYNGFGGTPSSIDLSNATSLPLSAISATGTPGATNFLRGDGTWSIPILTIATTAVSGATNGYLLYNNGGLLGAVAPTAASLSIGSPISNGALVGYGLYVDTSTQLGQFAYGTGVRTALGVNVGSAGAPVLFNGAGGLPSSIDLTNGTNLPISAGTTGNLPVTRLNSGTGATASTYWRGDGTWAAVSGGSGTVTSVAQTFSGGIISVGGSPITVSGTLALTVAGTSGGIPYFSSGTTWASSAALTLNGVVYGGGAGASPVSTAAGTTGQVLIATTSNAPSWGQVPLGTGVTGTLPVANGGTGQSTALTQYGVIYGSSATAMGNTAAGTTGQVLIATTSAAPSWGQVPIAGGGTGQTTTALGTIVVGASASTTTNLGIGSTSQVLTVVAGTAAWATPASGGTVTSVSVTTANGVSGTVATATTTPAISLTLGVITPTSVNGLTLAALSTGFTVAGGTTSKTLTVSNTLTLAGTDSTTMTFPPASASIGYLNIPQNSQGGNYTLVLADSGKHIYTTALATITIPANSSVAFPIGTAVTFINSSASATSIAITTDTMNLSSAGTTGTRTLAQYGMATAVKVTSTVWYISGTGLT